MRDLALGSATSAPAQCAASAEQPRHSDGVTFLESGVGTETSSIRSGSWNARTTAALIVLVVLVVAFAICEKLHFARLLLIVCECLIERRGPFLREERRPPALETLDAELRRKNPAWGVRNLETIVAVGRGLLLEEVVDMRGHNLTLALRK